MTRPVPEPQARTVAFNERSLLAVVTCAAAAPPLRKATHLKAAAEHRCEPRAAHRVCEEQVIARGGEGSRGAGATDGQRICL